MSVNSRPIPLFEKHEKFFKYISVNKDGCWEWSGAKGSGGYGIFGINYKTYSAHRISKEIFDGPLDIRMVIDHICKNRKCVNPDHLREVCHSENVTQNSNSGAAKNIIKTHCDRGHELSTENTFLYTKPGRRTGRSCKKCILINKKDYRERLKMKALLLKS